MQSVEDVIVDAEEWEKKFMCCELEEEKIQELRKRLQISPHLEFLEKHGPVKR
jgi:hypothetical protein